MSDTMSKVTIITRREKFDELKDELDKIGITGMTVSMVEGCGVQKGKTQYHRGAKQEVNVLPKIQIDIVICTVPVEKVIEVAKKVLNTGEIGDGKIFVSEIQRVVKIRTGEEDKAAL